MESTSIFRRTEPSRLIPMESIRDYYLGFLPHVRTRSNLRELLNDMVGELNSSHLGFYSSGNEEDIYYGSSTLATGIQFEDENPYTVKRIINQSPAWQADGEIQSGDRLIRVNGGDIDPTQNRFDGDNPQLHRAVQHIMEQLEN